MITKITQQIKLNYQLNYHQVQPQFAWNNLVSAKVSESYLLPGIIGRDSGSLVISGSGEGYVEVSLVFWIERGMALWDGYIEVFDRTTRPLGIQDFFNHLLTWKQK